MAGIAENCLFIERRSIARASPCPNAIPARLKSTRKTSSVPVAALQSKLKVPWMTDTVRLGFTPRKSRKFPTPEHLDAALRRLDSAAVRRAWKPVPIVFLRELFSVSDSGLSALWAKVGWVKFRSCVGQLSLAWVTGSRLSVVTVDTMRVFVV